MKHVVIVGLAIWVEFYRHSLVIANVSFGLKPALPSLDNDSLPRVAGTIARLALSQDIPEQYNRDWRQKNERAMMIEKIDTALVDAESLPWMPAWPNSDKVFIKLVRADAARDEWITLLKTSAGIELPRHHHSGPVSVYTIKGEWKYKENDWSAGPGSFVFEMAGSQHTPVSLGDDEVITLNIVQGNWSVVDDAGNTLAIENCLSIMKRYSRWMTQTELSRG